MTTFFSLTIAGFYAVLLSGLSPVSADAQVTSEIVFDAGGRPSAYVTLNDEAEYLFAIDTAAQRTTLGQRIVADLGLTPDPGDRAQVHGAAGVSYLDLYRLNSVELAGHRMEGGLYLSAAAHDDSALGHDGILGQEFFAGPMLVFDFVDRTVSFGGSTMAGLGESLPVELMYGGFAITTISIGGISTRALIDTGASESFANRALMEALGLSENDLSIEESFAGVTQQQSVRYTGYAGDVLLGAVMVDSVAFEFTDSPIFQTFGMSDQPAIILGMDVLGQLSGFAIDYLASEFRHLAD